MPKVPDWQFDYVWNIFLFSCSFRRQIAEKQTKIVWTCLWMNFMDIDNSRVKEDHCLKRNSVLKIQQTERTSLKISQRHWKVEILMATWLMTYWVIVLQKECGNWDIKGQNKWIMLDVKCQRWRFVAALWMGLNDVFCQEKRSLKYRQATKYTEELVSDENQWQCELSAICVE